MHVWVSRSGGGGGGGWNVGSVAGVWVSWYWCNVKLFACRPCLFLPKIFCSLHSMSTYLTEIYTKMQEAP